MLQVGDLRFEEVSALPCGGGEEDDTVNRNKALSALSSP